MKDRYNKLTIEEFTSVDPVVVAPSTAVEEVIRLFRVHRFRHLPVVEDGRPVGVISDRDILLARPMGVSTVMCARDVMTKTPYCVEMNEPLEKIALELSQRKFGSALVVDKNGLLCGIFTATDALNALVELLRAPL